MHPRALESLACERIDRLHHEARAQRLAATVIRRRWVRFDGGAWHLGMVCLAFGRPP